MWHEERKKKIIRNIILAVLCIAVAGGLLAAMLTIRAETKNEEKLLEEEYAKQQVSQTVAREMAVGDIDAEYQKDMDTVAKYLPGIVCWGDTLTAGSSGAVSYPYILQRYIDMYICDIYDFRASIKDADEYSRLDWDEYKVKIPVVNMGVYNEDTNTILGRSGVVPFVLAKDVTVPAGIEPVEISILSANGKKVSPLSGGNGGVNEVTIDGIKGTITMEADSSPSSSEKVKYFFTRSSSGARYEIKEGTPIYTAVSDMYKDYLHVVCIGTYGGYEDANDLAEQIKALLSRQTNNTDRYLVLGICYKRGWGDMSATDTVMTQAFGDHYVNIRKYLCSDGMEDAGITPSDEDTFNASHGIVPTRLRSSNGDAGLSAKAYSLIGKLVYDRLEKMGYLEEVKNELYIEEVQKELMKDNPNYFTNIIKNW